MYESSLIFFIVMNVVSFLAISLFIELVCVIIYGVMFPKLPMVQKHRARSGSNPVEPVEEVPPLSNQQLAHQNLDRVISLFLIYALTLSIFPGFLYENTGKHSLHLWFVPRIRFSYDFFSFYHLISSNTFIV